MLSARCPEKTDKNGSSIILSTKGAWNVFMRNLHFLWKRKIAQIFLEHNIHEEMISNFNHTPVAFNFPKFILSITNINDKR